MRIQVRIPPKTWEQVCHLAQSEHRPPKYQIELLLWKAIDQAAQTLGVEAQSKKLLCATTKLAGTVGASHV